MQPTLCARCHKNVAVIFVTKIENGQTTSEGLCLKCAREMGMKPVDDIMKKMGISDDDLEGIAGEMMEAFGGAEELSENVEGDDESGKTATFPFLNKLFGAQEAPEQLRQSAAGQGEGRPGQKEKISGHLLHISLPASRPREA